MREIVIIILLNALFCASLFCKDIGESIKNDASSLWSLPHDKFKTTFGPSELYKWQAFNKTLSYNFASGKAKLHFLGQQISKASFKFPAKRVNGMYLTFSKPSTKIDRAAYLKGIKDLQDNIKNLDKFPNPKLSKRQSGKWYRYTCSWKSPQYSISLRWAYSRDPKAPFKSKSTKLSVFYGGTQIIAKKETSETDIQNAGNGDFCLKVPMIVEESPENSLSTCVSRVMEYYAEKAGQDSKDEKQTNKNIYKFSNPANIRYDIEDMLKKTFSIQEVISPECFEGYMKFSSLIYTYNSYAENKLNSQYNKVIESKKKIKDSNYVLMKTINKKSEKRASINVDSSGRRILKQSYKLTRYYVYLTNMIEIILKMNEEDA